MQGRVHCSQGQRCCYACEMVLQARGNMQWSQGMKLFKEAVSQNLPPVFLLNNWFKADPICRLSTALRRSWHLTTSRSISSQLQALSASVKFTLWSSTWCDHAGSVVRQHHCTSMCTFSQLLPAAHRSCNTRLQRTSIPDSLTWSV